MPYYHFDYSPNIYSCKMVSSMTRTSGKLKWNQIFRKSKNRKELMQSQVIRNQLSETAVSEEKSLNPSLAQSLT